MPSSCVGWVRDCADLEDLLPENGNATGRVQLLVLEHEAVLDDTRIFDLYRWSPDDLERLARFRSATARTSWALSRMLMREVLTRVTGAEPASELASGPQGKPYLPGYTLRFNLAHCPGCVVFALAEGVEVGCDVERALPQHMDFMSIARDRFNADEFAWVESGGPELRWRRFLVLFVQKEAWLKAIGLGFSGSFSDAPCVLAEPPIWSPASVVVELGAPARYLAALFVEGRATMPVGGVLPLVSRFRFS